METALIVELVRAIWREIILWRNWLFAIFVIVMFGTMVVGMNWPQTYSTSTMIFVDQSNIIQPLLAGKANFTNLTRASEMIYSRKLMLRVAKETGFVTPETSLEQQESIIGGLRSSVKLKSEQGNYFSIKYSHQNPDKAFAVINAVVDAFIKESAATRREESRAAFEFIDEQVNSYKRQLQLAEDKIKEFQSKNLDGTTGSVTQKIGNLRQGIEDQKLLIGETEIQIKAIEEQLNKEGRAIQMSNKVDAEKRRLQTLQDQLDILRLSYQETYPDIVNLKEQIEAQKLVIDAMSADGYVSSSSVNDGIEDPLFDQLRKQKSQVELNVLSQKRRLASLEKLLKEEYARAERIASKQAELQELNRDYSVIKENYDQMLDRKEKARLSMTLDVQGQGINYKIHEPAVYPLTPIGLQFHHFAMIAPLAGLGVAIGLICVYVLLDARVRSPMMLMSKLPEEVDLLAVIPHLNSPLSGRLLRGDIILLGLFFVLVMGAYVSVVYGRLTGAI